MREQRGHVEAVGVVIRDVHVGESDNPAVVLDQAAVHGELLELKQAALLKGYRGSPALDVAALAELIVLVGRIMAGNPRIREIDLNPVIVHPEGEGILALDALMLVEG